MNLKDLRIIVTGAASGMGAHFAKSLAEAGARVAAGDIDVEKLAAVPSGVETHVLDVADEESRRAFVAWADERLSGVNALINNAGILRDGLLVKRKRDTGEIETMSTENWDQVLAVNLTGATLMVREVVASMLSRKETPGVIVNISSIARHGNRGQSNYVAAKAAMAANSVTWAREFARNGIRVAAVAPGMIETPMTAGMNQKALDSIIPQIPVGRIGVPDDIWLAVKFVLECEYVNATTIDVDGGFNF